VKQPLRQLRGFRRVSLLPGESTDVELTIAAADLGFWDVTRDRRCVETARHSILVGRSCADLRLTATLDVVGEQIPPRQFGHLAATSFDEYCAMTLTTASRDHGDAVISLEPQSWLAFHDVTMTAQDNCTITAGNRGTTPATIELRLDDPLHGELLGTVRVPPAEQLTTITGPLVPVAGVHTLYAVFSAADVVLESLTAVRP
jgi:beta-glucosidase